VADPALDDSYALDSDTIDAYRRDGHAVVRGLASADELAVYAPAIESAAQRHRFEQRPLEERDTYGRAFLQVPNLWADDQAVRQYVTARRFAKVAADLMGVDGVRLYHDQALLKEPGGGHTPWHQDQNYWPLATEHTITMWMPLVDIDARMGAMTFASGTHRLGALGEHLIGDPSQAFFDEMVRERDFPLATHAPMRAGDATFHAGWTLHSAPANPTDVMRSVMTVIYFADGTRVGEIDHPARSLDQQWWLSGRETGCLADGPGNPVLYHRLHDHDSA
jgi:ectoine hydroxylase-related dioxygenase (phytanoyl-CoA dioxygenase family)